MEPRTLYIPAHNEAEAKLIAEMVALRGSAIMAAYEDRAEVDHVCALQNSVRPEGPRYETFAVPVRETTTHDGRIMVAWAVDKVGDVAATVALFASIWAVGIASCWEALV